MATLRYYSDKKGLATTNKGVYDVVVTLCADYDRRKKAIAVGNIDAVHLEYYKLLNETIDKSIEETVDVGIRKQMLKDIAERVGHKKSMCLHYISPVTYKAQKREAIYFIAKNLQLI